MKASPRIQLASLAALSLLTLRGHANSPFDINKNGLIDPAEQEAAMRHDASPIFKATDKNFDGKLSDEEKEAYFAPEITKADNRVAGSATPGRTAVAMSYKEFEESGILQPTPSGEYWPLNGVQIRRTLADVDRQRDNSRNSPKDYLDNLKKAKAAEFGFANNSIAGDRSWSARGVIARPFSYDLSNGSGGFLLPSVQFDRVSHSKTGVAEIDNLIFGFEGSYIGDSFGPVSTHRASLGIEYGTNFDWDERKIGGKIEWEPTFESPAWLGNVNTQQIGTLPIFYTSRQFLHFEGGHAEATSLKPSDEYARLGAGIGANIYFGEDTFLKRLVLGADYRYYFDLATGDDDYENFRAVAEFRLDENGHFNLQAAYENGLIPLSHQKVEMFSIGLGVKY